MEIIQDMEIIQNMENLLDMKAVADMEANHHILYRTTIGRRNIMS